MTDKKYTLGIDIGSTTVKIAILDEENQLLFADYERHFANIQETLAHLLGEAHEKLGELTLQPVITGSGGLALANHLGIPFTQEVIAVSTSLKALAPQTDVAIELGGEDAKIIYFEGGNVEQRMNGICAGGTGSFIDQMASLLQTDATGLNEYAKHYQAIYPIAARCGVFAKTDIQPLINDGATKEDLSASIFQAVVNQTISGLACGKPIRGHVAFLGGPLHFLSELKTAFVRTLKLDDEHTIVPDNRASAALAHAVYNFLICKAYLTGSTPVDRHLFFICQSGFEKFQENPLGPVIVFRIRRVDLSVPVEGISKRLKLVFEVMYVVFGNDLRMNVVFDRIVLRWKTKCIPAHRIQNVVTLHSALSGYNVQCGVRTRMAYVKSLS